ncbi:adenosine deaminase [Anaerotignum sp.]
MEKQKMCGQMLSGLLVAGSCFTSGCGGTKEVVKAEDYAVMDLHLHLDGSLSVASVRELAEMQGISVPERDEELLPLLRVDADCRNLNEYLEKFDFTVSLLQTEEALVAAVYQLEKELQDMGMLYAEIRFAPQLHTENGLSQAEVVAAAIEGMNRCDFRSNLILCCMRGDDNQEQNMETVRVAKEFLGKGVAAIDIAGAEALYPTGNFENLFLLAKQLDIPFTIHAGEADGPTSVYKALEFGAKRIGHGVRSVEDQELMQKLAEENVTLELCPTSNLNTNIFESLDEYPLLELMEAGVKVTINSDNMVVSGTNVEAELQKLIDTFGLEKEQLKMLVNNAIDVSFADEETKEWLRGELEKRVP